MTTTESTFRETLADLDELIQQKLITVRKHPAADLWVYNYSHKAQFQRGWHPTTRKCRGLILDGEGQLVARPFEKFFNLEEHRVDLPSSDCEAYEKYDGSLGIIYWVDGRPAIASRGSFTSDQAIWGTAMLEDKYRWLWDRLDPRLTHLVEIIHPSNRIVVDYGQEEKLVLLSQIETSSGLELPPDPSVGFPVAECVYQGNIYDWAEKYDERENHEGYVIHWPEEQLRLKLKHLMYVALHRIVVGFSIKQVWESLKAGNIDGLIMMGERATPEFRLWLNGAIMDFSERVGQILWEVNRDFSGVPDGSRKEQAEYIKQCQYPHLLFAKLDGRDWESMAWDLVRPEAGYRTFRKEGE